MTDDADRKIEELASDLDDVAHAADNLQTDPVVEAHPSELERLQRALEEAGDAVDTLEEKVDEGD